MFCKEEGSYSTPLSIPKHNDPIIKDGINVGVEKWLLRLAAEVATETTGAARKRRAAGPRGRSQRGRLPLAVLRMAQQASIKCGKMTCRKTYMFG